MRRFWFAPLLLALLGVQTGHSAENGNGVRLRGATTSNLGLGTSTAPNGNRVYVAASPYVSKQSQAPSGARIMIGPAAIVEKTATLSRSRRWHFYE